MHRYRSFICDYARHGGEKKAELLGGINVLEDYCPPIKAISAEHVHALVIQRGKSETAEASVVFVDVRDADYAGGHIVGSLHKLFKELTSERKEEERMKELVRELKGKTNVIIYCQFSVHRGPEIFVKYVKMRPHMILTGEIEPAPNRPDVFLEEYVKHVEEVRKAELEKLKSADAKNSPKKTPTKHVQKVNKKPTVEPTFGESSTTSEPAPAEELPAEELSAEDLPATSDPATVTAQETTLTILSPGQQAVIATDEDVENLKLESYMVVPILDQQGYTGPVKYDELGVGVGEQDVRVLKKGFHGFQSAYKDDPKVVEGREKKYYEMTRVPSGARLPDHYRDQTFH